MREYYPNSSIECISPLIKEDKIMCRDYKQDFDEMESDIALLDKIVGIQNKVIQMEKLVIKWHCLGWENYRTKE